MRKLILINVLTLFLCLPTWSNEKSMSIKEENCFIYFKLDNQKQFSKIQCTDKQEYPMPQIGYDNNHCVSLRSHIFFKMKKKIFKNKNGLYCSMNGYSNRAYWYYVE